MDDRSDDINSRVAKLEAYSKTQAHAIRDLKKDLRTIADGVGEIRRDIHGARMAGRVGLGIALILGSLIAWIVSVVAKV